MNNAKEIAEKIILQNATILNYELSELARAYLELEKKIEAAIVLININVSVLRQWSNPNSYLGKELLEISNKNSQFLADNFKLQSEYLDLKSEITKLKEENETLFKDLKMCREIGVEMQREVNRKLSVENDNIKTKLSLEQQDRESEKREFKVFKEAAESEIIKLKKSREVLRRTCEFYKMNKHWNIVHVLGERPMLGERVLDKGCTAREAIKADDEIMKGE